ncbi:hypothetical protein FA13DRAFT_1476411 [Coprinellus micaceus]|uniref:Uncharacterized protein n=1 Tax=Coprinellus micaceus TaxID=71717 RepID=A0A4Y7SL47_COPMI|nr:hypothetical protein FA13DRAFT_1476411 [Coprinellus micaceus]
MSRNVLAPPTSRCFLQTLPRHTFSLCAFSGLHRIPLANPEASVRAQLQSAGPFRGLASMAGDLFGGPRL